MAYDMAPMPGSPRPRTPTYPSMAPKRPMAYPNTRPTGIANDPRYQSAPQMNLAGIGGLPPANDPRYTTPGETPQYWRPGALRTTGGVQAGGAGNVSTESGGYRNPHQGSFTYIHEDPGAIAGGGGYFPGHGAQNARNAMQNAEANYNQWRTGKVGTPTYGQMMAGRNGGGGTGGGLAGSYQSAFDEARAANEARYLEGLSGFQNRYERNMNDLQGSGAQEGRDIDESYRNQGSKIKQDLISRGLGNSTVLGNMETGNNRERVADQGRLQERLRNQRIGLDAQLSGDLLGFLERRDDTYPDYNQLAALAQGVGAAGGGVGAPIYASPAEAGYVNPLAAYVGGGRAGPQYVADYGGGSKYGRNQAEMANAIARRKAQEAKMARQSGGKWDPSEGDRTVPTAQQPVNRQLTPAEQARIDALYGNPLSSFAAFGGGGTF